VRRALALGLGALCAIALAHDAPSTVPASLEAQAGRLVAALDLSAALPPDLQKQLSNGLTNVVALHAALVPERGGEPVALYGRELDVLYDVWEDSWGVVIKDAATPRGRRQVFARWPELRAFLFSAGGVDLGPVGALGGHSWVVEARLELNPVSKELLERTREFIANPGAGGRGGNPSRSVLGAMASYLLKGADPGADVHLLRSAPFTAREVARR
jgi:hypothetical protein